MNRIVVDTKSIVVHLMKEDKRDSVSVSRVLELMQFLFESLSEKKLESNYHISYDINVYSIERMAKYNSDIFDLDFCMETLYLKKQNSEYELAAKYPVDETIQSIIHSFCSL